MNPHLHCVTAESVRRGHPDKLCDQIADSILDAFLKEDPASRVAIEVMATDGEMMVAGEIASTANVSIPPIIKRVIDNIGYQPDDLGTDGHIDVHININDQSTDIAQAVLKDGKDYGAGDQGIVVGYATDETPEMLPLPVVLAHRICHHLDIMFGAVQREEKGEPMGAEDYKGLGADGKAQVTVLYNGNEPVAISTVVVSFQHDKDADLKKLKDTVRDHLTHVLLPQKLLRPSTRILINPSGRFVKGGPSADTGLTGRKLAVDMYGPVAHIGGGAFCVDADTEFLTENGWKRIAEYQEGELVGQWDAGDLSFVKPLHYIVTPAQALYRVYNEQSLDMVISENHDVVFYTSKGNLVKKRLKDLMPNGHIENGNSGYIPLSFQYAGSKNGMPMSDDEIRLQVAFCADGTITVGKKIDRIRIKKPRKMERLEMLLKATGTQYTKTMDHEYAIYWFAPPMRSKKLSEHFWNASQHQLAVIAEEAQLWDGDAEKKVYRTTLKEEADFMQFAMMAATGKSVSIIIDDRRGQEHKVQGKQYTRKSILYEVFIKENSVANFRFGDNPKVKLTAEPFSSADPMMYCFCVPSGMLLLRRNNKVFVTGNSGKDPTKTDRSGAYAARWVAKNIVASGLASKCEVQIAYAIGRSKPVSVDIDTFGTGILSDSVIKKAVFEMFDLRPAAIIDALNLRAPVYALTSVYGHFGHNNVSWEDTSKRRELLSTAIRLNASKNKIAVDETEKNVPVRVN